MAELDETDLARLRERCGKISRAVEASLTYYLLEQLELPIGCSPSRVDALLCTGERDGYPTRLFFERQVKGASGATLNWNANGVRILERNWTAYSWKVPMGRSVYLLLDEHLKALA
jgi:hypothetical protein